MADMHQILAAMKVAGYHNDHRAFTRLYVEHRISFVRAKAMFQLGIKAKHAGVPCSCPGCTHADRP